MRLTENALSIVIRIDAPMVSIARRTGATRQLCGSNRLFGSDVHEYCYSNAFRTRVVPSELAQRFREYTA